MGKDEILHILICGCKYLIKTSSESWNKVPSKILISVHLFLNQFSIIYIPL